MAFQKAPRGLTSLLELALQYQTAGWGTEGRRRDGICRSFRRDFDESFLLFQTPQEVALVIAQNDADSDQGLGLFPAAKHLQAASCFHR